ncbi:unnamed protein product [Gongylonema pulchrum]|uniref:Uncharacterized protein n=1 Tax=Gongylonema pulchrum TaxID=637853 RepID=A0A3P7RLZ8_9BILA|nr:unnamed protein product [Gongylonema pulchrum]
MNGLQNDLKDQKATITFKGSISAFGTQSASSPGLSATMFQFSPLVEHFLQTITKTQPTNANLPLVVLDSSSSAPISINDNSDSYKVFPESNTIKNVTVLQSSNSQQQQPSTSHASISPYAIQPILTEHLQQVGEFSS